MLFTNVSFSFNSFKLLPLDDKVKDFFHIVYTPSGRMSAGLSTTITITFTPQLNEDINTVFPILSETGKIEIPLICTCKKALISVEDPSIDFGAVIFGEQSTQYLKINNTGALATKIYIKDNKGRQIPFVSVEEMKAREDMRTQRDIASPFVGQTRKASTVIEDQSRFDEMMQAQDEAQSINPLQRDGINQQSQSMISNFEAPNSRHITSAFDAKTRPVSIERTESELQDEFLAQVQFKRTAEIDGYSNTKI